MKLMPNSAHPANQAGGKPWPVPQWASIALSVGIIIALFVAVATRLPSLPAFSFRFNPYALLSLLAVITNAVVLVLAGRLKARTDDLMWFSLHIACLELWAIIELLTRISAGPDTLLFWWPLASLPSFLAPVALFMFALSFTSPRQSRHTGTIIPLLLTAFIMMFFDYRTPLFNHYDAARLVMTPWGGQVDIGPLFNVITIWIIGLYALTILMFIRYYRQSLEPRLRQQVRLYIAATLVPVVIGAFTDGILPAIGNFQVLPMAVMLTAVTGVIYIYAILKYRFLELNPLLIATNILETINEAVIGITPDLAIDYVNNGAERLFGYTPRQFARMRFTDLLTQEWSPELMREALFKKSQGDEYASFNSVELRTASAGMVTVKLSASKIAEAGQLQGYLLVITDITAIAQTTEIIEHTVETRTREVEEAKAQLISSINSLEFGFIMTNAKPEVAMVNSSAHDRFCGDESHAPSKCANITIQSIQRDLGRHVNLAAHIASCLKHRRPQELKDIVFDEKTWRLYLSPVTSGRRTLGCAILLQDTTQERLLERSRDEFFSIASHELRTPLTSIKGNSAMIMQYYQRVLKNPALKEMVEDIHESSGRLIEIVNDFLDVSRLEQGRIVLRPEAASLPQLIEKVVYEMGPLMKQKELYLHLGENLRQLEGLPLVLVDQNRLKQILFNLLGNGTKFTEKGGITIDAVQKTGLIRLTVSDTGPGIARKQQPLLFHKFQQAGSSLLTRDSSRGTGLGLYISRLLAREMGGNLELERSAPGHGSVFALELPVATPARIKKLAAKTTRVDSSTGLSIGNHDNRS